MRLRDCLGLIERVSLADGVRRQLSVLLMRITCKTRKWSRDPSRYVWLAQHSACGLYEGQHRSGRSSKLMRALDAPVGKRRRLRRASGAQGPFTRSLGRETSISATTSASGSSSSSSSSRSCFSAPGRGGWRILFLLLVGEIVELFFDLVAGPRAFDVVFHEILQALDLFVEQSDLRFRLGASAELGFSVFSFWFDGVGGHGLWSLFPVDDEEAPSALAQDGTFDGDLGSGFYAGGEQVERGVEPDLADDFRGARAPP
jgi:hypothetical protein